MSGGTWPGPPDISNRRALSLISSHSSGSNFNATLGAFATGASSVTVPFVTGPEVCTPTPCTPVPGAPLVLQVTVVGRS